MRIMLDIWAEIATAKDENRKFGRRKMRSLDFTHRGKAMRLEEEAGRERGDAVIDTSSRQKATHQLLISYSTPRRWARNILRLPNAHQQKLPNYCPRREEEFWVMRKISYRAGAFVMRNAILRWDSENDKRKEGYIWGRLGLVWLIWMRKDRGEDRGSEGAGFEVKAISAALMLLQTK